MQIRSNVNKSISFFLVCIRRFLLQLVGGVHEVQNGHMENYEMD